MEEDKYLLGSVGNALKLMDLLSHYSALSLAKLTELSGLNKSVVFRTMYTLTEYEYVEKTDGGDYRLGIKFLFYGGIVLAGQDIISIARPFLRSLAAESKQAAHLSALHSERVVTIAKEESPHDIQVTARIGMNTRVHVTAQGRAILAFLSEEERKAILQSTVYKQYSSHSVLDAPTLLTILEDVRRKGYATDYDDRFPGFGSIACPVFDHTGQVCAAVGVVGISTNLCRQEEQMAGLVKRCAADISSAMGCNKQPH